MSVITRISHVTSLIALSFLITGSALAVSVSPSVSDAMLLQGEESQVEFVLFHDQASPVEFDIDLLSIDLGADEEGMSFKELSPNVSSWLDLSDEYLIVNPGEIKKITLNIDIPANEDSQVQVLGLRVVQLTTDAEAINVQSGLISLVFLTVGDNFVDDARLLDFSSSKKISSSLPVSFHATLRNEDQRVLQPQGSVTVRNMFGGIVSSYAINQSGRRIPNGQQRTFSIDWGEEVDDNGFIEDLKNETRQFAIGFFKADLVIEPYAGGENITATTSIFMLPWRFLLVVTVVFALFYGVVRILRKK